MALEGRFFSGHEIDDPGRFVYRSEMSDFPIAFRELRKLRPGEVVKVEMAVAGALAGPDETISVLEEAKIVADVDPIRILFGEDGAAPACGNVGNEEIKDGLLAIEALHCELFGARKPVHSGNVDVGF